MNVDKKRRVTLVFKRQKTFFRQRLARFENDIVVRNLVNIEYFREAMTERTAVYDYRLVVFRESVDNGSLHRCRAGTGYENRPRALRGFREF